MAASGARAMADARPLTQTALGVDIIKQYPGPEQVELKVVNHIHEWLRPSVEEIVAAYMKLYGKKARDSDAESDSSDEEGEEKGEEEEEGEEEGEEE